MSLKCRLIPLLVCYVTDYDKYQLLLLAPIENKLTIFSNCCVTLIREYMYLWLRRHNRLILRI